MNLVVQLPVCWKVQLIQFAGTFPQPFLLGYMLTALALSSRGGVKEGRAQVRGDSGWYRECGEPKLGQMDTENRDEKTAVGMNLRSHSIDKLNRYDRRIDGSVPLYGSGSSGA